MANHFNVRVSTLFAWAALTAWATAIGIGTARGDEPPHSHGGATPAVGASTTANTLGSKEKVQGAGIFMDAPNYDFGKVKAGADIIHDFWFTNPGTETLKITSVRPSCGCTTTGSWDKEVPPGGSGRIPIKVATRGFGGRITKVVTIGTNVSNAASMQLKVEGEVWQPLQISPPSLSFGRLKEEEMEKPKIGMVQLHNNTKNPITVTSVTSNNPLFKAELADGPSIQPAHAARISVTISPPFTAGNVAAPIMIKTDSPDSPDAQFIATAFIPPPVSVSPAQLHIPADMTSPRQFSVRVECIRKTQVKILNVKCTDEKIKTTLNGPNTDKSYTLLIDVPANYKASPGATQVILETDEPSMKEVSVYMVQAISRPMTPGAMVPGAPRVTQPQGNSTVRPPVQQPANPPAGGAAVPPNAAGGPSANK